MPTLTLEYRFNGEPCTQLLRLEQNELPLHEAALHLIVLHHGDGENSLVIPAADADHQEILKQAELLGITEIKCQPIGLGTAL